MVIKTLLIALAALPALAQPQQNNHCKEMVYENNNQVDPPPLTVQRIKGMVTDAQQVPIPRVCLAVFTTDHKLVATSESDEQGGFSLPNIPPGRYRLVAKYDSFCAPNVPLRVTRHKKDKPLHVHMKVPELDSCSYIDLADETPHATIEKLAASCKSTSH